MICFSCQELLISKKREIFVIPPIVHYKSFGQQRVSRFCGKAQLLVTASVTTRLTTALLLQPHHLHSLAPPTHLPGGSLPSRNFLRWLPKAVIAHAWRGRLTRLQYLSRREALIAVQRALHRACVRRAVQRVIEGRIMVSNVQ